MPLSQIYIYRMVHIDNVPHILANGITHRNSPNANPNYAPIGDADIINTRNQRHIFYKTVGMRRPRTVCIGDCIPFYFGFRTPMLYVIQRGFNSVTQQLPQNIVYVVCSVQSIIDNNLPFYFTDGHAIDMLSSCYDNSYADQLQNLVDLPATKILDWTNNRDDKRKKEAEYLVGADIPVDCITGFVCYDENSQQILVNYGIDDSQVLVDSNRYF